MHSLPAEKSQALGQHSRRVLPMYQQGAARKMDWPAFRPPSRLVGPTLLLRARHGDGAVWRFRPSRQVLVSSQPGLPLTVPDPAVGKRHALLACQSTDWYVYDLCCPGGTFHNGQRVAKPTPLRQGDEVTFGSTSYLVDLERAGTGHIPAFDLLERIHVGNGGELYRARCYRPSARSFLVALRIFPANFAVEQDQIRRFLRAIPAAAKLRHDNIVRLYRGGMVRKDHPIWYLATEYMAGGSLRDRLQKQRARLPLRDVWRIGHDIGRALIAAARHRLIHRNINPSCILFDRAGTAKLGDFTLMRGEVLETMYEVTRGKLQIVDYGYMAPEVLAGAKNLSSACDVYSLAACLFEALVGRLPIDPHKSLAENLVSMTRLDWPSPREFNPDVPTGWEELLRVALSRDPAHRHKTPEEFLQALDALKPADE